jgi:hypothetical protein
MRTFVVMFLKFLILITEQAMLARIANSAYNVLVEVNTGVMMFAATFSAIELPRHIPRDESPVVTYARKEGIGCGAFSTDLWLIRADSELPPRLRLNGPLSVPPPLPM